MKSLKKQVEPLEQDISSQDNLDWFDYLISFLSDMNFSDHTDCLYNCSGRGECQEGLCLCQVRFNGDSCKDANLAYFISFATIFYLIASVSFLQLLLCIRSEYLRMKTPNLKRACAITTQKLLYIITTIAAVLRAAYFSSPKNEDLILSSSFVSAFYPIILTAGSLIVCFWAEAFHLRDIRCEKPRFLSKSFCGFIIFNIITYSLFAAEIFLTGNETRSDEHRDFLGHVFNGCYAVLIFIMVIFFLIYGVEVYFKIRGEFVSDSMIVVQSRQPRHVRRTTLETARPLLANNDCSVTIESKNTTPESENVTLNFNSENVNSTQSATIETKVISESQSATIESKKLDEELCSNDFDLGTFKSVESVINREISAVLCHENGESSSTPCHEEKGSSSTLNENENVLSEESNPIFTEPECKSGEKLSIVNTRPHLLFDKSQLQQSRFGLVFQACMLLITVCFLCSDVLGGFWKNKVRLTSRNVYDIAFRIVELAVALWFPCVLWNYRCPEQLWILNPKKILKRFDFEKALELETKRSVEGQENSSGECWICYDGERLDCGLLIQPCDCIGDVSTVHHNCLRKWLMESAPTGSSDSLSCKVCGAAYQLEEKNVWWIGKGLTSSQWLHTASIVTVICVTVTGFWGAMQFFDDALKQAVTAGASLIVLYICLRMLGFNFYTAYQRAKISAVQILNSHFPRNQHSSSLGNQSAGPSFIEVNARPSASGQYRPADTFIG